jgi:hypothetical protein
MFIELFENPILYGLIAVFLAVYGPRLHPRLPQNIRNLFNSTWFRTLVILLIVFLSSHDLKLSLLVSLVFLLILMLVDGADVREHFENCLKKDEDK